jgi:hypothetical protein
MSASFVTSDGRRLAYSRIGSGALPLCQHGRWSDS